VSTELVRLTQISHADMAANITQGKLPTLSPELLQNLAPYGNAALAVLNGEITRQALFIAYLDDFKLMMIVTFTILPLLLFMKRGNQGGGGPPVHMD
jgi:DHA2 family multidrug resistance protein